MQIYLASQWKRRRWGKTAAVLQESDCIFGKLGQHIERQIGKTISAI